MVLKGTSESHSNASGGFRPKGAKDNREGVLEKEEKKKRVRERETHELVYPMTIRRVTAALIIADNIVTGFLVGVQTGHDHTSVCALGRQARARLG